MIRRPNHDNSRREDHHGSQMKLAEVGNLGRDVWTRAQPGGLESHRHPPGFWELCWLERGRMDWQVDGLPASMHGGDCFLTRPGELHGGQGGIMHSGALCWITVDLRRLPGLAPARARALRCDFNALRLRSFPASAAVGAAFSAILAEFRRSDAQSPTVVRATLHVLLIAILRAANPTHAYSNVLDCSVHRH
ncbi:MAG: AraC family ligand binding domain-containing protein, partial [Planctomycetota bacterium]